MRIRRESRRTGKIFLNFTFIERIKVELFAEMCYNKNVLQCRFCGVEAYLPVYVCKAALCAVLPLRHERKSK